MFAQQRCFLIWLRASRSGRLYILVASPKYELRKGGSLQSKEFCFRGTVGHRGVKNDLC
jgi:hypothetical protein